MQDEEEERGWVLGESELKGRKGQLVLQRDGGGSKAHLAETLENAGHSEEVMRVVLKVSEAAKVAGGVGGGNRVLQSKLAGRWGDKSETVEGEDDAIAAPRVVSS